LNAMGFYQVCPGRPVYSIGRPLFAECTLRLPGGRTFTLRTKGNGRDAKYVKSATLNGRRLKHLFFTHEELMRGGVLELKMGKHP
ncbi:MAG: glycoside hydrolase family 92 protein, partial [Bacteroidaceae bacterium]|nr:glycoside hydrolase family 92 protein [Bacteroidaceae bacterium]